MFEMEVAARVVIEQCGKQKTIYPKLYPRMFRGSIRDSDVETGFLHLLSGGYLTRFNYNGEFTPNPAFWARIPEAYKPSISE